MIRLGRDALTLSDGLSTFCFMGISGSAFWQASRSLDAWHIHWHWCTFIPSFGRNFRSRWSGGISGNWLDMDPVSGIVCSGVVIFHSVWSLSVFRGPRLVDDAEFQADSLEFAGSVLWASIAHYLHRVTKLVADTLKMLDCYIWFLVLDWLCGSRQCNCTIGQDTGKCRNPVYAWHWLWSQG